jgi:hypothetical protein
MDFSYCLKQSAAPKLHEIREEMYGPPQKSKLGKSSVNEVRSVTSMIFMCASSSYLYYIGSDM